MRTSDALKMSIERGLDLVEVGPNAAPPITKIMDYGKYVYQKERQEKKSGARPREQETKTVRVGYKTGIHDLAFKARKVDEFLGESRLVKVELTLRGREKALAHLGKDKLKTFLGMITFPFTTQDQPKRSPFGWVIMIQPSKQHGKKPQDKQVSSEKNQGHRTEKDSEAPPAPEPL